MIIAHRGASAYAPDNTIAAIKKAFELGSDGIEIDVQMSRDGELFIFHDWNLEKVTGDKALITSKSSAEIKNIDAGSWFSPEFAGERIPALEEVLDIVPKGKLVNIEIKKTASDTRPVEEKVLRQVSDRGMTGNVIISSFNHKTISTVEKIDAEIKTALIMASQLVNPMKYLGNFRCYSFHPVLYYVDEQLVKELHANNIKIYPWVVNDTFYAKELTAAGCDGIITNYPDLRF
ncbi:MAG: glycerophosphodiester phosphodiesterase [Spirochaetales bacterium]|nr:glycerophosphodiester phosphodiesterase [Spirochaetales bacterium]